MPTLHFKGKPFLRNYHHAVKFHNLIPKKSSSLTKGDPSLDDNLIVHGDNLKAIKALLPTHAGKVKCIYIDPPYNTGNENWVYNDNVASPMIQKWLKEVVAKDDLTRHDKWCCMMYPRLTLLREMLSNDGVIFVSIDDNEVHHLKMMMDEIFGEENFVVQFVWKKGAGNQNDNKYVAVSHEYAICYAKDISKCHFYNLPPSEEMIKNYKLEDEYLATRGKYQLRSLNDFSTGDRPGLHHDIKCPDGSILKGSDHRWRCDKERFDWRLKEGRIVFEKPNKKSDEWTVYYKQYANEKKEEIIKDEYGNLLSVGRIPTSLILDVALTGDGKRELKEIFENESPFNYPKPSDFIKHFLLISTKNEDVILDSFAGSGTTAHAVLALNKEDGGNRKFILIECEDYADKITAERVRRVMKGTKDGQLELGEKSDSFSYFELGEPIEVENILDGKNLPNYEDLAKYVFFTATGEKFDSATVDRKSYHIGSSGTFEVYLIYEPEKEKLKKLSLNLDFAQDISKKHPTKQKLVFAPCCFIEEYHLKEYGIRFAQLPFEIYRIAE